MCVTLLVPASASESESASAASSFWWIALRWLCGLDSAEVDEHARAVAAATAAAEGKAAGTSSGSGSGSAEAEAADAGLEYVRRERENDRAAGWKARAAHYAVNAGAVFLIAYYVFLYAFFR